MFNSDAENGGNLLYKNYWQSLNYHHEPIQNISYNFCLQDVSKSNNNDLLSLEENILGKIPNNIIIKEMYLIQNPQLYLMYETNKILMSDNNDYSNEKLLFHGCYNSGLINSISDSGVMPELCIKNLYGRGSYFSTTFEYCCNNGYCADLGDNLFQIFVFKVCVGRSVVGNSHSTILPIYNKLENTRYNSFVDNTSTPSIYAIQNKYQAEPLFSIYFSIN
jgi:hypothetical protein